MHSDHPLSRRDSLAELHRLATEKSPSGIFIVDSEDQCIYVNEAGCLLSGYAAEELKGKVLPAMLPEDQRSQAYAHFERARKTAIKGVTFPFVRRDGSPRWWSADIVPLNDGRFLAYLIDITETLRCEEQRRKAQKMEAVARLAGGVAHDFNNLLTPILGYAEMLLQACGEDHPNHRDIAAIVRTAERARNLTTQLLAFSRKQVFDVQVVNLNDVVREEEVLLRRLLRQDIRLDLVLQSLHDKVRADVSQLRCVLTNLVINAVDALPDGGVICVETRDVDLGDDDAFAYVSSRPGPYVLLAVGDDGCGMDGETIGMIFEPFFTTKKASDRAGLGLASVDGIVRQHQGFIEVHSEPAGGTIFKIYLPRFVDEANPPAKAVKLRDVQDE